MKSNDRRRFSKQALTAGGGLVLLPGALRSEKVHPLDRKIGRIFFLNMYWRTPPDFFLRLVEKYHVGGAYLDKNSLISKETCRRAVDRLKSASAAPLFLITDCEGGVVNRLRRIRSMDSAQSIGRRFSKGEIDEEGLYKIYAERIKLMRELGLSFNFGPVLDLSGPYIRSRSFGSDPDTVARICKVILKAYSDVGVHATGKHFPGMGTVAKNPHRKVLPAIETPLEKLHERELVPFKAAIDANISSVLVGHPYINAIDPDLPASLSQKVIQGFIRGDLGYDGIIWPDSLTMGMIKEFYERKGITGIKQAGASAVAALRAGVDQIFNFRFDNSKFPVVVRQVRQAVQDGTIPEKRIDQALERTAKLHARYNDL